MRHCHTQVMGYASFMSSMSTVLPGNQTKLPAAVVKALSLKPSSKLIYQIEADGRVVLSAKTSTFAELADSFPKKRRGNTATDAEIKAAVQLGAVKRFRRSVA